MPVLPVLVIFTAAGLAWLLRRGQFLQPLLLVVVTAYFTYLILFVQRAFMFPFYIGTNTILREHFRGNPIVEKLMTLLPSFLRAIDSAYPKMLLVAAVVLVGMLAAIPLNRLLARALRRTSA